MTRHKLLTGKNPAQKSLPRLLSENDEATNLADHMRKKEIFVGLSLLLLGVIFAISPWSPLSVRSYYIDLHTGRFRAVRKVASITVTDRITETSVSTLWKSYFGNYPQPEWQIWGRFVGRSGRSTPDYQITWKVATWEYGIEAALEPPGMADDVKREVIKSYIKFLEIRDPISADFYLSDVVGFSSDNFTNQIHFTNAPTWLIRPEVPYQPKTR